MTSGLEPFVARRSPSEIWVHYDQQLEKGKPNDLIEKSVGGIRSIEPQHLILAPLPYVLDAIRDPSGLYSPLEGLNRQHPNYLASWGMKGPLPYDYRGFLLDLVGIARGDDYVRKQYQATDFDLVWKGALMFARVALEMGCISSERYDDVSREVMRDVLMEQRFSWGFDQLVVVFKASGLV